MDRTSENSCGSASFDGDAAAATIYKPSGSPGYSDQDIFSQQGAFLARVLDVTHADDVVREVRDGAAPTMQSRMWTGGNQVPVLSIAFEPGAVCRAGGTINTMSPTLAGNTNSGDRTVHVAVGFSHTASGIMLDANPTTSAVTLKKSPGGEGAVGFLTGNSEKTRSNGEETETSPTVLKANGDSGNHVGVAMRHIVRRLTPTECERLQGFPDGYTRIPYRGKPAEECPDSPRYRALGNSWATNCAEWVLRRIVAAMRLGIA